MAQPQTRSDQAFIYQPGPSPLGRVISIEGIADSGKTTQCLRLMQSLRSIGIPVDQVQDLSSNVASKAINGLIDAADSLFFDATSEMLLSFAARHHVVNDVISPAIGEGKWIISEGFTGSAYAYFHSARGLDRKHISDIDWISTGHFKMDLAIILDLPVEQAAARRRTVRKGPSIRKRYQHEHHNQILREAYQAIAKDDPERYQIIDASRSPDEIALDILSRVTRHFSQLIQPAHG